jgi:hypothetical protein
LLPLNNRIRAKTLIDSYSKNLLPLNMSLYCSPSNIYHMHNYTYMHHYAYYQDVSTSDSTSHIHNIYSREHTHTYYSPFLATKIDKLSSGRISNSTKRT